MGSQLAPKIHIISIKSSTEVVLEVHRTAPANYISKWVDFWPPGTSEIELSLTRELNFHFYKGAPKSTKNDPQKWPLGPHFESLWAQYCKKWLPGRHPKKWSTNASKNDSKSPTPVWNLGSHFPSFLGPGPHLGPKPKNVRFLTPKCQKYNNFCTEFWPNTEEKTPKSYPNTHRNITRGTRQYLPSSMKKKQWWGSSVLTATWP